METFQVHPLSLQHLLSSVHERQLALPDFQRDFVWDPRATEELIESIARSFPAGSLLFMPYRADTFTPRQIQNAPELKDVTPNELILDGQQRLTSLYQAFYGVGDYRYFMDLGALFGTDELEEAVFYRHRNRCGSYEGIKNQADRLVLPLGVLFSKPGGFHSWRDEVLDHRPEVGEALVDLREQLRVAYNTYIKTCEGYRFPVVSLDHDTSLEAVCSIFETLNRTGIRLSVFELLAARFYAKGLDLRRKWQETRGDRAIIEEFAVDEYYVLQGIALRARKSAKRGDVLRLSVADIQTHWDPVTHGFRAALEMLRAECGVKTAKWLPYGYLVVPLAAVWKETIDAGGPDAGANRERFKRWFWCSAFSQSYDRAAATQATKDFNELSRWTRGGEAPESVSTFVFDAARLREITPKQQAIYKALISLILRHGAKDFHHAHELTVESIRAKAVDDHHIFPRAYLNPDKENPKYPTQLVDCILNRTLIDNDTNKRIGKRAPSDYLGEVRTVLAGPGVAEDAFGRLLESHILPEAPESPLLNDDFDSFLAWRQTELAAEMSKVTSAVVEVKNQAIQEPAA